MPLINTKNELLILNNCNLNLDYYKLYKINKQ